MNRITQSIIDQFRERKSLDTLISEVLDKSKLIDLIDGAKDHPAIRELILYMRENAVELQKKQNQLSESPARHEDEIRSLNALRKVTENFVSFFDIPEQVKKEVFERKERLYQTKEEAELHNRQTTGF